MATLKTTDFADAKKFARIMDALGYLDTIHYISNHLLYDEHLFHPDIFYKELVTTFEHIYQATLSAAGLSIKKSMLMIETESLKKQLLALGKGNEIIYRQVFQLIKDKVDGKLDSIEAFALSRTVEFHNHTLCSDDLFKEVYTEGFRRSWLLSRSEITGDRFFRAEPLHENLKGSKMFDLYKNKSSYVDMSRSDKVFDSLKNIDIFLDEYIQCLQEETESSSAVEL